MKEKTKSYMAGIFDAEGCIRIATHKRGSKTYFEPNVYLSNKSRALMQWSVLHFGGSFTRNVNNKAERIGTFGTCNPSLLPLLSLKLFCPT